MSAFWEKCERVLDVMGGVTDGVQTGIDVADLVHIPVLGPVLAVGAGTLNLANGLLDARAHSFEAPQSQRSVSLGHPLFYDSTSAGRTVAFTGPANTSETLILESSRGQRLVRTFKPGETVAFDFDPGVTVTARLAPPR
jgi:hypothetical protein